MDDKFIVCKLKVNTLSSEIKKSYKKYSNIRILLKYSCSKLYQKIFLKNSWTKFKKKKCIYHWIYSINITVFKYSI